jgi:hypothetical protein
MTTLASSLGITILFATFLGIGIVYAVLILVGAGLHDIHLPGFHIPGLDLHVDGHDFGVGHGVNVGHVDTGTGAGADGSSVKVPSLSPITVASFVTAFGAFGLIGLGLFDSTVRGSLVWAALGGFIVAIIAHFAFGYFLIAPQGSSGVMLNNFPGMLAEVITPIPVDSVGEIALVSQGGRVTYTAQSSNGEAIPRGATVMIDKVIGGVAMVHIQEKETSNMPG